jgi:DNA-directed RNA polymerase specialized sigma24 family protein
VSDQELIRRFVNRRDEGAFRALYARHTPAVYGLLRRLAGPAVSDADDALQDAWLLRMRNGLPPPARICATAVKSCCGVDPIQWTVSLW